MRLFVPDDDHQTPPHLTIEFDGPRADPGEIDPRSVFEVAARYVDLVRRVAEKTGSNEPITLSGFEVHDKCTQIRLLTDAPIDRLRLLEREVFELMSHPHKSPHGLKTAAQNLRKALDEADPGLRIGQRDTSGAFRVLREPKPRQKSSTPFVERSEVRARVQGILLNPFRVRLRMRGEPRVRWLNVDASEIEDALRRCLSGQRANDPRIDIDARVKIRREGDGRFISGELLDFREVPHTSVEGWRAWAREHMARWDEVDDIERSLGRTPFPSGEGDE